MIRFGAIDRDTPICRPHAAGNKYRKHEPKSSIATGKFYHVVHFGIQRGAHKLRYTAGASTHCFRKRSDQSRRYFCDS